MTFTPEQIKELQAPLNREHVKSRSQAGRDLSYIEAYHAENEANRIFGFDAWDRYTELTPIGECEKDGKWRVYYRAKVRIVVRTPDQREIVREGCGYGSGIDKDIGQAHESALKEAESDAEKRALKTFGNPFGQALYDKSQANVQDAPPPMISDATVAAIAQAAPIAGVSIQQIVEGFKVSALDELTAEQGEKTLNNLKKRLAQHKEAA